MGRLETLAAQVAEVDRAVDRALAAAQRRAHVCAVSGGMDSLVLWHALVQRVDAHGLCAVHVDHGSHASDAACWERCRAYGQAWSAAVEYCSVVVAGPEGFEGNARRARYTALRAYVGPETVLWTAHHRQDQALTLLLQLSRGAGVRGLAAMAPRMPCGLGIHARPFLTVPLSALAAYAAHYGIRWAEDASNADLALRRNALQIQVWPQWQAVFPEIEGCVARSAEHLQEAAQICRDLAAIDYAAVVRPGTTILEKAAFLSLPVHRHFNLLAYWLEQHGVEYGPSTVRIREFLRQVTTAGPDRHPCVRWGHHQIEVRHHGVSYRDLRAPC